MICKILRQDGNYVGVVFLSEFIGYSVSRCCCIALLLIYVKYLPLVLLVNRLQGIGINHI